MGSAMNRMGRAVAAGMVLVATVFMVGLGHDLGGPVWGCDLERPWERREIHKRQMQDKVGGLPENILKRQSLGKVAPPSIDAAAAMALKAAEEAARPLIDTALHKGRRLTVPDDFKSIQSAIDAAKPGDIVLVKPGTYYAFIVMKDGVNLVPDSAEGGKALATVEGAQLRLPRGTLRTIIGNIVHDNAGGGILGKVGQRQGVYPIDGPTHATLMNSGIPERKCQTGHLVQRGRVNEKAPPFGGQFRL